MSSDLRRPLSDREWEVARLVARGKSYKSIGDSLGIEDGTARAHVNNIAALIPCDDDEKLTAYRRIMLWVAHNDPSTVA